MIQLSSPPSTESANVASHTRGGSWSQWSARTKAMVVSLITCVGICAVITVGWILVVQLAKASRDTLLEAQQLTKAVDLTRSAQVNFKKQVQEWKDMLLRGNDPESFKRYSQAFGDSERATVADLNAAIIALREL